MSKHRSKSPDYSGLHMLPRLSPYLISTATPSVAAMSRHGPQERSLRSPAPPGGTPMLYSKVQPRSALTCERWLCSRRRRSGATLLNRYRTIRSSDYVVCSYGGGGRASSARHFSLPWDCLAWLPCNCENRESLQDGPRQSSFPSGWPYFLTSILPSLPFLPLPPLPSLPSPPFPFLPLRCKPLFRRCSTQTMAFPSSHTSVGSSLQYQVPLQVFTHKQTNTCTLAWIFLFHV